MSGAEVNFSVNNRPFEDGSKDVTRTDGLGNFTIKGAGLSLHVAVSKDGYYRIPPKEGRSGSSGGFAQSLDAKRVETSPDQPVIYRLHKAGQTEPLIRKRRIQRRIAKDGVPTSFFLANADDNHRVLLECWTDDHHSDSGRYDWKLRVSVPDGGLLIRTDNFMFQAPGEGYQASDEHQMLKFSPSDQWQHTLERSYFIRFNDRTHARIDLIMNARGDHFAVVASYYNPGVGSTNLEADPRKP